MTQHHRRHTRISVCAMPCAACPAECGVPATATDRSSARGREGATTVSDIPRVPIVLSEYQREQLIRWVSAAGTPARVLRRSRIILQLASGYSVHRASQVLAISEPTIRLWRDRFRFGGLGAITTDAPRPGRPRRARGEARTKVSECLAAMPQGTHSASGPWLVRPGLGRHLVQQVLIDMGLLPEGRCSSRPHTPRGCGHPAVRARLTASPHTPWRWAPEPVAARMGGRARRHPSHS